ncbi:MAG: hypothetical protein ACRYGR_10055 [Janthinobacterium lividum]
MYLKKFLIFIFLMSPVSFATDPQSSLIEREEMEKRLNQVSRILTNIINTGKSIDDMLDEEKEFLQEYKEEHNIDITRPIESIGYAYIMRDIKDNKLFKMNVKSEPIYFSEDVDFKSLNLPDLYKIKLFLCSDANHIYEGYIAFIYERIPSIIKESSIGSKNNNGKRKSITLYHTRTKSIAVSKKSVQDIEFIAHDIEKISDKLDTSEDDTNDGPKEMKKKLKFGSISGKLFRKKPK